MCACWWGFCSSSTQSSECNCSGVSWWTRQHPSRDTTTSDTFSRVCCAFLGRYRLCIPQLMSCSNNSSNEGKLEYLPLSSQSNVGNACVSGWLIAITTACWNKIYPIPLKAVSESLLGKECSIYCFVEIFWIYVIPHYRFDMHVGVGQCHLLTVSKQHCIVTCNTTPDIWSWPILRND